MADRGAHLGADRGGMRRAVLLMLGLVAALALVPAGAGAVQVQAVKSPAGIEAWLVEDHSNPIISLDLAFRGGSTADPAGKPGVAYMVSALLDEGAGPLESLAFQKTLEDQSIGLGFEATRDHFRVRLRTLSQHRDAAFDLLRLALTEPRFDDEPVSRIRAQILGAMARELQQPDVVAVRQWFATAFPDHPYGRPVKGTPDSVKAIAADDLRAFVHGRFARHNMVLAVVGDITPAELGPLLDSTLGALPEQPGPLEVAAAQPTTGRTVVIERPIPQTVVLFGGPGIMRKDPDWYAGYVVNYVLGGGGFASRLMEEVRVKRGLAYSVTDYLMPMDHGGVVLGTVASENSRVAQALDLIRAELRRMAASGPTAQELANAKTYLTGAFPLQLDSTNAIAGVLVAVQLDDLGIDFLDKRNSHILAVTLDQARLVAKRLYDADRLTVVAVGAPQGLEGERIQPPDLPPPPQPGAAGAPPPPPPPMIGGGREMR